MATRKPKTAIPVICVPEGDLKNAGLDTVQTKWAKANGFTGQPGRLLPLPDAEGSRTAFLFGLGDVINAPKFITGLASVALEPGHYALSGALKNPAMAALGFKLGAYSFNRYRSGADPVTLAETDGVDQNEVNRLTEAAFIARDLINTPPNDLGPDAFDAYVRTFAKARKMKVTAIKGDALLDKNFPMIHAVGRASAEAPRLMDLTWGHNSHPKVTLVGKGVTFDTGGLDIKPPAGMLLMKKDMGGAANILGLAHAIIDAKLKVRLRVLLPIVENAISASAFRPGDILPSRAGLNVEIGNTDAEGRLILADALSFADEEKPELLLDMATLTGAARVALGPELPPLYTADSALAADLISSGLEFDDPLWQMPLWASYDRLLASRIADVNHISPGGFAGSITAALFLQRFVSQAKSWVHLDIFGWAPEPRPGRSHGGADQGIRAVYGVLKQRYS